MTKMNLEVLNVLDLGPDHIRDHPRDGSVPYVLGPTIRPAIHHAWTGLLLHTTSNLDDSGMTPR